MEYEPPNHEIIEDKAAIRSELQKQVDEYLRRGGEIKVRKPVCAIADLTKTELEFLKSKRRRNNEIKTIEIK